MREIRLVSREGLLVNKDENPCRPSAYDGGFGHEDDDAQEARLSAPWQRIIYEHNSVPFHMDGSFRAAVDLEP